MTLEERHAKFNKELDVLKDKYKLDVGLQSSEAQNGAIMITPVLVDLEKENKTVEAVIVPPPSKIIT